MDWAQKLIQIVVGLPGITKSNSEHNEDEREELFADDVWSQSDVLSSEACDENQ